MTRRARSDAGFSLIEVVVSLTLLSVVLTSLAGLMFQASRRANGVSGLTPLFEAATQQVNWVSVLPYDTLPLGSSCKVINNSGFSYTRCVQVDSVQVKVKRITLTITPANTTIKPVTEVFLRAKLATNNPLNNK
jgi:prepilin-type N-terminal cleavage/methylation domain-containing protein